MTTFNQSSNFGNKTSYGKELDKNIDRYKTDLENSSGEAEDIKNQIGEEKSAIIKKNNSEAKGNIEKYRSKIDDINSTYEQSIKDRREQADGLVDRQKDAAGLEANIAAAKGTGGKLAVSQLTSISRDITNQFSTSINNAIKDNINFQSDLDTKLADMGFSVIDKKKVLDEFKKVLTDEEAAPLLDAIASKYKTREGFMKALADTIKGINTKQIGDSATRILRSERLTEDENAFNAMTNEEKARDIRDRLGVTWNVLTKTQKQQLINDTVNGTQSLRETLDMIKNLKDKSSTNKEERQVMIGSDAKGLGKDIYQEGALDTYRQSGTTTGDRNYTGKDTKVKKKTNTSSRKDPQSDGGYKVGKITYTSKADYNMIKKQLVSLRNLRKTNPTKFKQAIQVLKNKYIIS